VSLQIRARPRPDRSARTAPGRPPRAYSRAYSIGAVALVVLDSLLALLGHAEPVTAAAALVLAPGLALAPFLPSELSAPVIRPAVIPLLGIVASSIAIISVTAIDIPLTATTVRVVLLILTGAALLASMRGRRLSKARRRIQPIEVGTLIALAAVVCLAMSLQALILGGTPLPGQDWGHYLLYVDQIRHQHALLINNPYWMLGGLPSPQDPGVPSLYGAFALLSHEPTGALVQGIWIFTVFGILSVFVFVGTLWGSRAGLYAAGVYAAVPMNLDMLAWHGLANEYALDILPLALLPVGMALRGRIDRRWSAFFGLMLIALATAHRLTFLVTLVALFAVLLLGLRRLPQGMLRFLGWSSLFALVLGAGAIVDLSRQAAAVGPLQSDYHAFSSTKVSWDLVNRDLSWELSIAGAVALGLFLVARPLRRDPARLVLYGLLAAILAFSYAWIVHLPTAYYRAPYYLPLLLAAAVGAASARLLPRVQVIALAALIAFVAADAYDLAPIYRSFYTYVDRGSLSALGYVKAQLHPRDVVVTDTCWGFLAGWLLKQPILAAQDPALILPKSEIKPAETAARILYGGKAGATLARTVGARFALVDPLCTHQTGRPVQPPDIGTPVFASTHLVVLDLTAGANVGRGG
jgi:hypothetical protein